MSLEEAARRTVEGMAGKLLLSAAVTIIIGFSGWTAHQINDHGEKLSGISQKLDDLVQVDIDRAKTDSARADTTSAAIDRLASDEQAHAVAIARAEAEIESLRSAPPRVEREALVSPAAASPPNVFKALSHIFSPPRPHWRRHN